MKSKRFCNAHTHCSDSSPGLCGPGLSTLLSAHRDLNKLRCWHVVLRNRNLDPTDLTSIDTGYNQRNSVGTVKVLSIEVLKFVEKHEVSHEVLYWCRYHFKATGIGNFLNNT